MTAQSPNHTTPTEPRYSAWWSVAMFAFSAALAGATVAGPGLTWDEPAYRHSQVTLQNWLGELRDAKDGADAAELFSRDSIDRYWTFNRFGHNFHPPMGSYLNLLTYGMAGRYWDDISSRRLASALQFAAVVTILCHFMGKRYGTTVGVFAGLSLLTMPRLMGHAHVIGTDMPLLLFWVITAVTFHKGLDDRRWQWAFALSWSCLFLVKFSGVVIGAPLVLWFFGAVLVRQPVQVWKRWFAWTLCLAVPLLPVALTLLLGARQAEPTGSIATPAWKIAQLGMTHPRAVGLLLFWPLAIYSVFRFRRTRRQDDGWNVALELPWVAIAVTPLACIALNPTWWHESLPALARYFDLNLNRQEALPDIGVFYLGKRYLYSLPWHNGPVLMAVTIPWGALLLGAFGCGIALFRWRRDALPIYLLLQMVTLPLFRMAPTPAHDGVRLFLPTFFFWAALAGLGAGWLAHRFADATKRRIAWTALFALGPVWAAVEWARIHPYELSYYNVGLPRAVDLGFETTFWYDAVTPRTLEELNERIPTDTIIYLPDPLINTETFGALQQLGRLRGDIRMSEAAPDRFPWIWLLTHSSKATPFTRLLYACKPWYESGVDEVGVRLFSVVDSDSVGLASALNALAVVADGTRHWDPRDGGPLPLGLYEPIFSMPADQVRRAVDLVDRFDRPAREHLADEPPAVGNLVGRWTASPGAANALRRVLRLDRAALDRAIDILAARPEDVRFVIETPGYQPPERFGGYFEPDTQQPIRRRDRSAIKEAAP